MTDRDAYREDLALLTGRIRDLDPPDLASRFASHFSLDAGSYHRVEPVQDGTLAAVDGSNTLLLDAGCLAVAVVRAAACGYENGANQFRSVTPLRVLTLGREARDGTFAGLYRECFGYDPVATVRDDEPARTAGILRDTLEYHAALEACTRLSRGDLLVLDGALRVTHASHDPVMKELARACGSRGVRLSAVTKRTAVTWGGGYPLVPAALSLARAQGIRPPWFLSIGEGGLDITPYGEWRHGRICVAALHPRSPLAFKLEVPEGTGDPEAGEIVARLAGWSDDGRVTGYPYPLLDAHRTARIPADALGQVKNDLLAGLDLQGGAFRRFEELFGDIHDEFARY